MNKIKVAHYPNSCGCFRREATAKHRWKHGFCNLGSTRFQLKVYHAYQNMISRCYDPSNKCYHLYGERGIGVSSEWIADFNKFKDDIGLPLSLAHTIERKDVNLGYSASNCCWATVKEQALNKRNTLYLTIKGIRKPLKKWAEDRGMKYRLLVVGYFE